jgi:hypothetical protein
MDKTKALSFALIFVASTGLVSGSFGFTSVSAERGVSVQIVDDESAFVGYQSSDLTVRDSETIDLVTVTNRFAGTIDVMDVTIADGSFTISDPTTPTAISPGESGTIQGTVDCTPSETQEIEVTVALDGSGVTVQLFGDTETREFTLTCVSEEETPTATLHNARFNGAGNFEVNTTNVGTTKIVYWTADKKWTKGDVDFTNQTVSDFDTSQKLKPQATGNNRIVAVYFPKYNVTFVHPNYYHGNWGTGNAIQVSGKHHPSDGDP